MAIVLALLGLMGIVTYLIHTRQREISIRRVLGVNSTSLWKTFSQDFVWLWLGASTIALPISYFWTRRWIQAVAFQPQLSPLIALAVISLALSLPLAVIGLYTCRATRHNPVEHLSRE